MKKKKKIKKATAEYWRKQTTLSGEHSYNYSEPQTVEGYLVKHYPTRVGNVTTRLDDRKRTKKKGRVHKK